MVSCTKFVVYPGELTATALAKSGGERFDEIPSPIAFQATPEEIPLPPGQPTPTIGEAPEITDIPEVKITTPLPPILYYAQSGDSLSAVAQHFNVKIEEITSPEVIEKKALLNPNQLLIIPNMIASSTSPDSLLPDSELVNSPTAINFNIEEFIENANGYLVSYREYLPDGWQNSAEIIRRVSLENSINPRVLLAILEYESHWVYGKPTNLAETDYPMGWKEIKNIGLYRQLKWASLKLSEGYYGWRTGDLKDIKYIDSTIKRINPQLNAGSVALQYYFSKIYRQPEWSTVLYSQDNFTALYKKMFGNPWLNQKSSQQIFPDNFTQPTFELPFQPGRTWSLTAGPHYAWFSEGGALAAVDFAPPSDNHGCSPSDVPITAPASGIIARSENGVVILDLDGDGYEQTGWNIFFLHVANKGRVPKGKVVKTNDVIGYPSCEGGTATGTHVHMARKFNGEWVLADGPIPMVLSGWQAVRGDKPYGGKFIKDGKTIIANTSIESSSLITRSK